MQGELSERTHKGILICGVINVKGTVALAYTTSQDFNKCGIVYARKGPRKALLALQSLFEKMLERFVPMNHGKLPVIIHLFRKDNIDLNLKEDILREEREAMNQGMNAFIDRKMPHLEPQPHPSSLFVMLFNAKSKIETSRPLPTLTYLDGNEEAVGAILGSPREFLMQFNDPRQPNQPNRLAKLTIIPDNVEEFDGLREHPIANAHYRAMLKYNVWITLRSSFAFLNWPGMISKPHVMQYARQGAEFMHDGVMTFSSGAAGQLTNGPPRHRDDGPAWATYFRNVNNHLRQCGLDLKHLFIWGTASVQSDE